MRELHAQHAADELRTLNEAEMEAVSGGRADYDNDGRTDWVLRDNDFDHRSDSA